jgi:co-chaperonin GroES (HSP10)
MFSVTQNGKELDKSKYNWDERTKTFSTNENNLVLDFSDYFGCTFKTDSSCTFNTASGCTFETGFDCIFDTDSGCTFKTDSGCTFKTGSDCTFNTGNNCTFKTASGCTFKTGDNCIFNTGSGCTFKTGDNCVGIRCDVKGIIEIPKNKIIKLNGYGVAGYIFVEEKIEIPSCNGKIVEIDGKKYKLVETA